MRWRIFTPHITKGLIEEDGSQKPYQAKRFSLAASSSHVGSSDDRQ